MRLLQHILFSILLVFFGLFLLDDILNLFVIFLASILIDMDHYFYYLLKKKDGSFKNFYKWFSNLDKKIKIFKKNNRGKKIKAPFCIFHTIEFLFVLLIFSFYTKTFLFVFAGFIFHSFLDIVYLWKRKKINQREFSAILFLIRKNKKDWAYI